MTKLYDELALVYEAMYQTFINYEEEFNFYSSLIKQYGHRQVLEIGSGTGHLAQRFEQAGVEYTGLDYSAAMIAIAQSKYPHLNFIQGDMRDFQLPRPVESMIVTARTLSYLISNADVHTAFKSMNNNLKSGGLLCFDFIDANRFIPAIDPKQAVVHEAHYQNEHYRRESFWSINLQEAWTFDWESHYYRIIEAQKHKIGADSSLLRTFTRDDIQLLLTLNGFEVKEWINRPTYAFDTFVVVANKT